MQGFIGIDAAFAVVDIIKAFIIRRFQLAWVKIGIAVDLCIARHGRGAFDFF